MSANKKLHSVEKPWYGITVDEVVSLLKSDLENGLSDDEAANRLIIYGQNELVRAKLKSPVEMFIDQFKDFMIGLLIVAALISGFIGEAKDTIAILVIIIINAVIGFVQEFRAEKAMEALKELSAPSSTGKRNGRLITISAVDVVPGDVIFLEAGNIVPADLRLSHTAGLSINESILTGESLPVDKITEPLEGDHLIVGDRVNMAFSGTQVTRGRGAGIVVGTAMETEIGKIAGLVQMEEIKTPLQKRLAAFGRTLVYAVIAISAIVFGVGVASGVEPSLMFLTAVSLAVAAVPEALPAVVTISLALGAQSMVRQEALIRRLPAVETLGSVTHICSDKTGTLTQNKMSVEQIFIDNRFIRATGTGYVPLGKFTGMEGADINISKIMPARLLMQAAVLNNDSRLVITDGNEPDVFGDPTELSLLVMAAKAGFTKDETEKTIPRTGEVPFDSERKRMTTLHQLPDGHYISFTKGAFEILEPLMTSYVRDNQVVPMTEAGLEKFRIAGEKMASQGLRTIALTVREWPEAPEISGDVLESNLALIGIVGIVDPPREEAIQAVSECKSAGIKTVMITGDHPATARAIGSRLGIYEDGTEIITGKELAEISLDEFEKKIDKISVFARVAPEHKVKILKALQDKGYIAAMTGDGVNDAPALKNADIGVAMGITGTDVSKEAADMVLLDDNFATIVGAVKEGRRIYDNIRRFIKYTLTSNSGEILVMFLAPFLGLPIPLLPIQILWINLVTDGLPGLAMAVEQPDEDVMKRPPRHPKESVFARGLWQHIIWVGLLMAGASLFAQGWFFRQGGHWQTSVFTVLCLSQLGHAMAVRSENQSLFKLGTLSNPALFGSVILTLLLQMAIIYLPVFNPIFRTQPLNAPELIFTMALSTVVFIAVEIEKYIKRKY